MAARRRVVRGATLLEALLLVGMVALVALAGVKALGRGIERKVGAQAERVASLEGDLGTDLDAATARSASRKAQAHASRAPAPISTDGDRVVAHRAELAAALRDEAEALRAEQRASFARFEKTRRGFFTGFATTVVDLARGAREQSVPEDVVRWHLAMVGQDGTAAELDRVAEALATTDDPARAVALWDRWFSTYRGALRTLQAHERDLTAYEAQVARATDTVTSLVGFVPAMIPGVGWMAAIAGGVIVKAGAGALDEATAGRPLDPLRVGRDGLVGGLEATSLMTGSLVGGRVAAWVGSRAAWLGERAASLAADAGWALASGVTEGAMLGSIRPLLAGDPDELASAVSWRILSSTFFAGVIAAGTRLPGVR